VSGTKRKWSWVVSNTAVECKDLTIGYGATPVGRDLNLTVDVGEVVCLLGAKEVGNAVWKHV
jgi:ABC-type branched-subunit amino acid transport system ATPase component